MKEAVCLCDPVLRADSESTGSAHLLRRRLSTLRAQWTLLGTLLESANPWVDSNVQTAEKHCTLVLGWEWLTDCFMET